MTDRSVAATATEQQQPAPARGASAAAVHEASLETLYGPYRPLIDDWPAFCRAMQRPLAPVVRANTRRITREALATLLARDGLGARPLAGQPDALELAPDARPGRHWAMLAGLFQIQEAASLLPVRLLDVRPGHRVLDLCAAPGNKTVQIADALGGWGTVVANDASRGRASALSQTIKRHGVFASIRTIQDGQGFPAAGGTWDRILVDAPCSCEGNYRKSGRGSASAPGAFRDRVTARQARLLARALALVRRGGRVVYSTCTFAPEENEAVVAAALAAADGAFRIRPVDVDGLTLAPGLTAWGGERWDAAMAGCARLWPHHNDTGGFFAAVIERVPDCRVGPDPEAVAAETAVIAQDADACAQWAHQSELFGLPADAVAGLQAVRVRRKYIDALGAGTEPPPAALCQHVGAPAVGVESRPPKLATAAALALGDRARRRVVELDADEVRAYLQRQSLYLAPTRWPEPEGKRPVVVRFRGYTLGMGEYRAGHLVSLYPKGWVTHTDVPGEIHLR
jgi:16S rRNA C967 or C1407 C5-methylase (RsmB/RsmF family)